MTVTAQREKTGEKYESASGKRIALAIADLGACAVGKLTTICSGIKSFFTTTYGV